MKLGICETGFIPLRAGISHKSEMLNQILFGEIFEILIHRGEWLKIRLIHDSYEGWVEEQSISYLNIKDIDVNYLAAVSFATEHDNILIINKTDKIHLPIGSVLHTKNKSDTEFSINNNTYSFLSKDRKASSKNKRETIINNAIAMLNTSYLWGGRTPWGIDCSGFSQLLYRMVNIYLPRDASQQIDKGHTLNFLSESKPGDLAFFDNNEGIITHVGIILEDLRIIHASKKIRIDKIDHQGIYNHEIKKYTHNLRVIKSII